MPIALRKRTLPYDAEAARRHLVASEPVMRQIVQRVGPYRLEVRGRPYQSLLRALLYQQLAGAAASAIERRFLDLFAGRVPEPEELLAISPDRLRAVGLSRQKAGYLHSLAEHFATGRVRDGALLRASDQEVVELVTPIKGVGRWTVDMLLIFCLGRPDVLPVGDLGVRRVMKDAYRLDALPEPEAMLGMAEPWRPYRSAAAWYLSRSADIITEIITL